MDAKSHVSQSHIARSLGISQALVSKILNGRRERIKPETYEAVWAYAMKVGYRPKGMTPHTTVAVGGNRQIGIVLRAGLQPFLVSNYFSHVQAGLHRTLLARGYNMVILGTEESLQVEDPGPIPPALIVLGVVDAKFLRSLRKLTRRIVAVMGNYPGLCHTVRPNETQSVELIVDHLAALGHRRFGWIGGLPNYPTNRQRFETLQDSLRQHGLPPIPPPAVVNTPDGADRHEGRVAINELFSRPGPHPTAVIAFNGVMARGAVNGLLQDGWKLPEHLSIAAIDATRACTEETPHITCASSIPETLGAAAAELLLESTGLDTESYQDITLAAKLQVGATTGTVTAGKASPKKSGKLAPRKNRTTK